MASAIGSPALVARNAAATHWSPRHLGKIGEAGAVNRVGVVASLRSSRKQLCGKASRIAGRRSGNSSCVVRADFLSKESDASRPGVGETVSLRDVASGSQGGVGDSAALRDISSEAAAEGGATPELHKTAKDKAEHSPLHESVEDIEEKADEVASAVAQESADGSGEVSNGRPEVGGDKGGDRPLAFQDVEVQEKDADRSGEVANGRSGFRGRSFEGDYTPGFQDIDVPEKAGSASNAQGDKGRDTEGGASGAQAPGEDDELPTPQEIGAEIVETIKDGIEQLKWSAESVIQSGGYARMGFESAKEAIDKRLKGLSVAAEEVREIGAQAAEIAQKGWGGISGRVEDLQKEVSTLAEELQSSSDELSTDGSKKSKSQILQALSQAEERARAVGNQVTEAARQIGDQAHEQGSKVEKALRDIQEQARQVGNSVGDAAQDAQNRGGRVSESSGKIIREAEDLSKKLAKGGESEPNSQENFAEKLQNQGMKVSTSAGNVVRESEELWRDLLNSDKPKDLEGNASSSSGSQNDDSASASMKIGYEDEQGNEQLLNSNRSGGE